MGEHASLADGKTESKPRLTKEEVDRLEKEFRKNPKPSSSVKAGLADSLGLERARINNWFQNRRAKAKQEKKQEEYEARRAAEQDPSESASPQEYSLSDSADCFGENQRMHSSSAPYPDASSSSTADPTHDHDGNESPEGSRSPDLRQPSPHQDDSSDTFPTQLPVDLSSPEMIGFSDAHAIETFSHGASSDRLASPFAALNQALDPASTASPHYSGLASSNAHTAEAEQLQFQFHSMAGARYTNPMTTSSHRQPSSGVNDVENSSANNEVHESLSKGFGHGEHQNIPSPGNSFRSPPPPANIASRRNISHRPAALQAVALKTRSHGPRTAIDGTIRRIASSNGSGTGRIQKSSAGPRSPMSNSKQEALFRQYQHGPMTAPFSIGGPPTPMTPAVVAQQEPTVSSNSSEDDTLEFGVRSSGFMLNWDAEQNLKTPPQSPSMMINFNTTNFMGHYLDEQQVFTPYSQTGFPEFSTPGYVDGSDGSQPATPLYPHAVSLAHSQNTLVTNGQVRTEYDWDANKPVMSKSPPSHSRARALQFAKNVTPRNYPHTHER